MSRGSIFSSVGDGDVQIPEKLIETIEPDDDRRRVLEPTPEVRQRQRRHVNIAVYHYNRAELRTIGTRMHTPARTLLRIL